MFYYVWASFAVLSIVKASQGRFRIFHVRWKVRGFLCGFHGSPWILRGFHGGSWIFTWIPRTFVDFYMDFYLEYKRTCSVDSTTILSLELD